ncbi:aspartyl-phosphate phosphatase Spo0E family protein [Oceanobacillus sp. FSL K6-2867]|uniref:aspartyl-phosphate phosphatase Spo0E family protein n=1 Tax=Oceanobacillus sp. FSL K6-2867 TaxID=2954748 RepID=UPI0030D78128
MKSTENILSRIEFLRKKMTDVALRKGFTDNESIYISQELDRLLNLYEKVKHEKPTTKS